MAAGPAKRASGSVLNKALKTATAKVKAPFLIRPKPTSPQTATATATKPKTRPGVQASTGPLPQAPPPPPLPATATAPVPLSTTTSELTNGGGASGGVTQPPPPPPPAGGSGGQQENGEGEGEAPQEEAPRAPFNKWKAAVWTLAFTAITVTGTIYGAGLKTRKEWEEVCFFVFFSIPVSHLSLSLYTLDQKPRGHKKY